ncbi:hypothetical protein E1295_15450 [Nonomuraea mesophila]|uniref:Knr4/Smi1-like domain-containing protein n=1 Tax=Nonomuraea mesophila TaxID=2530382 RepID=A0A4R5FNI6_9ACTN|nr:SMI1/KNR4 family protein [Nonomuraea mesophila]TDE54521.1 hypothetical protein E1295_15450 [Nonomuraea mesophila]
MLKLVRLALTAAVVTAIVVRLRRRARMPKTPPPPPPRPVRRTGMGLAWAGITAVVALTLVAALVPTQAQETATARGRAYQEEQDALIAQSLASRDDARPTSTPPSPVPPPTTQPQSWAVADGGCVPEQRRARVRPVDPKVRRAVNRQWRRIERWLKANAPRTYRTLGAPGRARTIAIAEAQMGLDFPDDLRASLLRHNGSRGAGAFGFSRNGAPILGVRQIRDAWRAQCAKDRADPGHDPVGEVVGDRAIPFLGVDGRYAVLDPMDGAVGWEGAGPRMPSYYALMRAVADALETGTEIDGLRPAVRRGVLRWDNAAYHNS